MKLTNFQKNKYLVIKQAISLELAEFVYKYFLKKRKVARFLFDEKYISQFTEYFGVWNDKQVLDTYSHYSDIAMETLLEEIKPIMEKHTGLELQPSYSYARIYKKGDELKRHKDRFSCEISTTMNLGGDEWPIYLEPSGKEGMKGVRVDLKPGDMLVYHGCELEHWREKFTGNDCGQVFLHYNKLSETSKENLYDARPFLGLPNWFKGFTLPKK